MRTEFPSKSAPKDLSSWAAMTQGGIAFIRTHTQNYSLCFLSFIAPVWSISAENKWKFRRKVCLQFARLQAKNNAQHQIKAAYFYNIISLLNYTNHYENTHGIYGENSQQTKRNSAMQTNLARSCQHPAKNYRSLALSSKNYRSLIGT